MIDTDGVKASNPFEKHQQLGGYGEVFWIKNGLIIESMGKDCSMERFDDVTKRLIESV